MGKSTCIWPECEDAAKIRGFCRRDYGRAQREGNFADPWVSWKPKVRYHECRWPECGVAKIKARGLCRDHYRRAGIVGDMTEPWKLWRPGGHCIVCGVWADGTIHGQKYCSDSCNVKDWKRRNADRVRVLDRERVRRRRAIIRETQVERFTDQDVRMAHGDICYLCGDPINFKLRYPNPDSPSVDHIVPLARGGTHTLDNCAMTHWGCNNKKNVRDAITRPATTLFTT